MAERNDISGLLAYIGREGDWRARLQDVVAEHLMAALAEDSSSGDYKKTDHGRESGGRRIVTCRSSLKDKIEWPVQNS